MRVIELQEGENLLALTVRRWHWWHFVTETWLSEFTPDTNPALEYRSWYRDQDERHAGQYLSLEFDHLVRQHRAVARLRDKLAEQYDKVISLDERRKAK